MSESLVDQDGLLIDPLAEPKLVLSEREVAEIRLSLFYATHCHHGSSGHGQYMLIAKLAEFIGFDLEPFVFPFSLPPDVLVMPEVKLFALSEVIERIDHESVFEARSVADAT